MKNKYEIWMTNFMNSWKNLEGVKTTEYLTQNVQYYESPDDEKCVDFEEVKKLWEVVPNNQKVNNYSYKIILSDDNCAIINCKMQRILLENNIVQNIDGIFYVKVNDENKCTYFKQWRSTK